MHLRSLHLARIAIAALILSGAVIAGCGGGGGGGTTAPGPGPQPSVSAVPAVQIVLFSKFVGSINQPPFGTVQGFTQQTYSQVLGLSPGQQIMLTNGDTHTHTFNVYAAYPTPPPPGGTLDTTPSNTTTLDVGYRSGPIAPGTSVGPLTVTNTLGNLYIACAFHFGSNNMQDGAVVSVNATPGPQASAPAGGGGSPPPCHGPYC